ncbi:hypothetical protein AB1N83_009164 [Pleurotus pulmonarius]
MTQWSMFNGFFSPLYITIDIFQTPHLLTSTRSCHPGQRAIEKPKPGNEIDLGKPSVGLVWLNPRYMSHFQHAINTPISRCHVILINHSDSFVTSELNYRRLRLVWSADVTEHAHITFVKNPADHTNNQNYENQICRFLDRVDKTRRFDLATSIREAGVDLRLDDQADRDNDIDIDIDDMGVTNDIDDDDNETPVRTVSTSADLLDAISPTSASRHASMVDYFAKAAKLLQGQVPKAPLPYRTFIVADGKVCINLPRDHALKKTVDQVAELYALPDLRAALNDFLVRAKNLPPDASLSIGGRRIAPRNASLPFFELQVWSSLRIQSKAYHHPHNILPAQTLSAVAPAKESQYGKYDAAVVNLDTSKVWPASALDGHCVVIVRLLLHIVPPNKQAAPWFSQGFLAYVERLTLQPLDASTSLHPLKRAVRSSGETVGDIIFLPQIRSQVDLVPRFGAKASSHLTKENSVAVNSDFWLNKYWNKELFYTLL